MSARTTYDCDYGRYSRENGRFLVGKDNGFCRRFPLYLSPLAVTHHEHPPG